MHTTFADDVLEHLINLFGKILYKHSSSRPCGDFFTWCLSNNNQWRAAWLRLIGLVPMHNMTAEVLSASLPNQVANGLLAHSYILNAYLTFEVVSDDMAIGLAAQSTTDQTAAIRRRVLLKFNDAMISALTDFSIPASRLLEPIESEIAQISFLDQMLAPERYRQFVDLYHAQGGSAALAEVDQALLPILISNIEACRGVVAAVAPLALGEFVRESLIARYRAVSITIKDEEMPWPDQLEISADAILVTATLGYYLAFLLRDVDRQLIARAMVKDGGVPELLSSASLLIRLLNDLGTTLLTEGEKRKDWLTELQRALPDHTEMNLGEFLLQQVDDRPLITRLAKDLTHGEFNLGLKGLLKLPADIAYSIFASRLHDLAQTFTQTKQRFAMVSDSIDALFGTSETTAAARDFVKFHERIYSHSYTKPEGEYSGI